MRRLLLLLSLAIALVAAFPFQQTLRRSDAANCRVVVREDGNHEYTVLISAKVVMGGSIQTALREVQRNTNTNGHVQQYIPAAVWDFLVPS